MGTLGPETQKERLPTEMLDYSSSDGAYADASEGRRVSRKLTREQGKGVGSWGGENDGEKGQLGMCVWASDGVG